MVFIHKITNKSIYTFCLVNCFHYLPILSANSWRMSGIESNISIPPSNTFQRFTIPSPIFSITIRIIAFIVFQIWMMNSFICKWRSSSTSRLFFAINSSSASSKRDNNSLFKSRSSLFPSLVAKKFNLAFIDWTTNSFDGCVHVMLLYEEKKEKVKIYSNRKVMVGYPSKIRLLFLPYLELHCW